MPAFRLAHLSDPHLGPLPPVRVRELASKRVFGYLNWQRSRRRALAEDVLDRLVDDIARQHPDHVAVTGDLVNIALAAEFAPAARWLARIGPPEHVSLVPGNHDAYVPGALAAGVGHWAAYMAGDDAQDAAFGRLRFPYVRRRGEVAIVGVSSAAATVPLSARGVFRPPQAAALELQLAVLGEEGRFRIVLIHHPPLGRLAPVHKRLVGARRFQRVIAAAGAELVLHGHTHVRSIAEIAGPSGPVPVVGVTSASAAGPGPKRARYNLFEIERCGSGFSCRMSERGTDDTVGPIRDLAHHVLS